MAIGSCIPAACVDEWSGHDLDDIDMLIGIEQEIQREQELQRMACDEMEQQQYEMAHTDHSHTSDASDSDVGPDDVEMQDDKPFKVGILVDTSDGSDNENDKGGDGNCDMVEMDCGSSSIGSGAGNDDLIGNERKKVRVGRETSAVQTLVSIYSLEGRAVDLGGVESLLQMQLVGDGKVLEARADRFNPAVNTAIQGETGAQVQTDAVQTVHLEASEDGRPFDYRVEQYVKAIVLREPSLLSNMRRSKTLSMVVVDAYKSPSRAKELLKSLCATKDDRKQLRRAFKSVEAASSIVSSEYALALLQHWYAAVDVKLQRREYGSYELVKANVEKVYTKLTSPYCFVQHVVEQRVVGEDRFSYCLVSPQAVRGNLENTFFYVWKPSKDGGYEAEAFPFVSTWLKDEDIKTRSYPVFDPSNNVPDVMGYPFNTWLGFAAERLSPVSDEVATAALARFGKHVFDVVGDSKVSDFVLDYFAHILQHPEKKTGVCVLLQGSQGCGKGTIFDPIREIVGHDATFQCSGPKAKDQLFGKFSVGLKNTVFVQIDEAKDMFELDELVKDVVVIDRKQFEDKGVQPYKLKVFANIVVTSNADHPIAIPDTERRWVAVRCKETHTGDTTYFTDLHTFLKKPETLRGIYQALMRRDIADRGNMQHERPITQYYLECRNISMCPLARFLSALCNSSSGDTVVKTIQSSALYKDFLTFAAGLGGDAVKKWNVTLFGLRMKEYADTENSGISMPGRSGKSGGVVVYIFQHDVLLEHLKSRRRYDEHAELHQLDFAPPCQGS